MIARLNQGFLALAGSLSLACLTGLVTFALCPPTAAVAVPVRLPHKVVPLKAEKAVKAGTRVRFFSAVDHVAACSAHLNGSVRWLDHAARFDRVEVSVDIPPRAEPGKYRITLRCAGAAPVRLQMTVYSAQPVTKTLTSFGKGLSVFGAHVRSLTSQEALLRAHERWLEEGAGILAAYRSGECTDWAAQKRPDVVRRVFEARVVAELMKTTPPAPLGVAQSWAPAAAGAGMTVSQSPAVGALVVWQEGVERAGAQTGHIGYVESVSADGSTFSDSSMNVGGLYEMGYTTRSSAPVPGRLFIWP